MIKITAITNNPLQNLKLKTESGVSFDLTLRFLYSNETQGQWFFSVSYFNPTTKQVIKILERALVKVGNLLYQQQNILPFGLACVVNGKEDPIFLNDFVNDRVSLFTLEKTEADVINTIIYSGFKS